MAADKAAMLTAMQAAARLGLSNRDRMTQLARLLDLGKRQPHPLGRGAWEFDPDRVELLRRTGLVRGKNPAYQSGARYPLK